MLTFLSCTKGTDNRWRLTVEKLHLDSALLDNQRKKLIDGFLSIDDEAELQNEIKEHLDESQSVMCEFFTMIEYLHGNGQ